MKVAVIIAGGSGARMGQDIPKQFINVYDKLVLIYTLESFQNHPLVDAIEVVCIDGWQDVLWAYAKKLNITKLKWVVSGGANLDRNQSATVYITLKVSAQMTISLLSMMVSAHLCMRQF